MREQRGHPGRPAPYDLHQPWPLSASCVSWAGL